MATRKLKFSGTLPLAGWKAELLAWYGGRQPSEQRLLRMAAVVVPVLVVLSLVSSLHGLVTKVERRVTQKRADVAYLRGVAPVLASAPRPAADGQSLLAVVDASSREAGLTLAGTDPIGTAQLKIRLENAPFDQLVGWLIRMQEQTGVGVQAASIERAGVPGQVTATLTLARP